MTDESTDAAMAALAAKAAWDAFDAARAAVDAAEAAYYALLLSATADNGSTAAADRTYSATSDAAWGAYIAATTASRAEADAKTKEEGR